MDARGIKVAIGNGSSICMASLQRIHGQIGWSVHLRLAAHCWTDEGQIPIQLACFDFRKVQYVVDRVRRVPSVPSRAVLYLLDGALAFGCLGSIGARFHFQHE